MDTKKTADSGGAEEHGARAQDRVRSTWLFGMLFLFWMGWFLIPNPLGLFLLVALALKERSRRAWLAVALATSIVIPTLVVGNAAVGYVTNTTALRGFGLPGPEAGNLDPATRLRWSSSGCLVTPVEATLQPLHNGTLRSLASLFGPPPGAYAGPLPDRDEAPELLARGALRVDLADLADGEIRVGERAVPLATRLEWLFPRARAFFVREHGPLLLIAPDPTPESPTEIPLLNGLPVALVHTETGEVLATYSYP